MQNFVQLFAQKVLILRSFNEYLEETQKITHTLSHKSKHINKKQVPTIGVLFNFIVCSSHFF